MTPPIFLKYRFALAFSLLVTLVMGVVLWLTLDHSLESHYAQEREQVDVSFALLAEVSRKAINSGDYDALEDYLYILTTDPHITNIAVADSQGQIVASTQKSAVGRPLHTLESRPNHVWLSQPVLLPGSQSATVALQHDTSHASHAFHQARNFGLMVAVIGMLLVVLVGIVVGNFLTQRLGILSSVVQRFAEGDLKARFPAEGRDELSALGQTFNSMAASIDNNIYQLKRAEETNARNYQIQRIIAAVLQTSQENHSLDSQLDQILELVLSLPWLQNQSVGGAIFTMDRSGHALHLRCQRGMSKELQERCNVIGVDNCLCGQAATEEKPVFIEHVDRMLDVTGFESSPHSQYSLPIIAHQKVLGVLCLRLPPDYRQKEFEETVLSTIAGTIGTIIDRRLKIDRIRTLSRAMEQSPASIIITDTEGKIEYINPKFTAVTGYTLDEVRGQNPRILKSNKTSDEVYEHLWETINKGMEWVGEFQNRRKNGELFWEYASISGIRDEDGNVSNFIAVKEDITERKEAEERNRYLAYTDQLTLLPNKTSLTERFEVALEACRQNQQLLALLIVNPVRFREINDTLGHENGDKLLRELANRIADTANSVARERGLESSPMVARLGGDEFAVLLPRMERREDALYMGDAVARIMEQPFHVDDLLIEINPSIGISLYPEHADTIDHLMRGADVAMHAAKNNNKPIIVYTPDIDDFSPRRLTLIGELRQAISRNELELYYQPKVDLKSDKVIAVEALLRWKHSSFGFVSPVEFIPLAERSGLIRPLTQWVLNEALRENNAWRERGVKLNVAVNLSAMNLMDIHLPELVKDLLDAWDVPEEALILEITETAVMLDPESSLAVLTRLNEMGIKLSIDDYGTGYSSLAYIRKLPVHELKIDRSFVQHMATEENDATIVRSTIALAHNLGFTVIAEGVEDDATLRLLGELDCDLAQGYYISRPIDGESLIHWLNESRWCAHSNIAVLPPRHNPT